MNTCVSLEERLSRNPDIIYVISALDGRGAARLFTPYAEASMPETQGYISCQQNPAVEIATAAISGLARAPASSVRRQSRSAAPASMIQLMLDGVKEGVALVGADGTILAINRMWKRSVDRTKTRFLDLHGNYFKFLRQLQIDGDKGAGSILVGVSDIFCGRRKQYHCLYKGQGALEGKVFRIKVSEIKEAPGAGIVLVSAVNVDELLSLKRQRRKLETRLLRAQEDERRRMARDLHDSTAQLLTGLQLSIATLKRGRHGHVADGLLSDCSDTLDKVQQEIRALSFICHPPNFNGAGFVPALIAMIEGFAARTGLKAELAIEQVEETSHSVEATLFRLAQEALSNIHRHAHAQLISVTLRVTDRCLHLIVRDDGIGFHLGDDAHALGVGVSGMKERLVHLGGRLSIRELSVGTELIGSLPRHRVN
jgi:two-component system, NarL family, sensor kinase